MTYREALATAVDFIRGSGTEDRELIRAAKQLERKAEKMRARSEVGWSLLEWCDCGERKPRNQNFCHACYSAFPMKLSVTFLRGAPRASSRAFREMRAISAARMAGQEKEAA